MRLVQVVTPFAFGDYHAPEMLFIGLDCKILEHSEKIRPIVNEDNDVNIVKWCQVVLVMVFALGE
jgi:hypothetical protein